MLVGYREPNYVGSAQLKEPSLLLGAPAEGAYWRRGSILINKTAGTIVTPTGGLGALAAAAGPAAGSYTITDVATAGAPAASYYIALTYTATGAESQSTYVLHNSQAGFMPSIEVLSAGAPAGATDFAAYMGTVPGYIALQQATRTTTALGVAYQATYPLAANQGWAQAATGTSTGIVGFALADSNATYFDGPGGSFLAGNAGSRLGASVSVPPLTPFEAPGVYAMGLANGQKVEMNLVNTVAYFPSLLGSAAGLTLDAATGIFVVDPAQTACLTIVSQRDGVYIGPTSNGTVGDLGARVEVVFNSSALAIS